MANTVTRQVSNKGIKVALKVFDTIMVVVLRLDSLSTDTRIFGNR